MPRTPQRRDKPGLESRPFPPRSFGETTLADGRSLAWAEYGHPEGDPLLWYHGTPGARTQLPPAAHKVALQRGFRIITVDRPGTGASTDHQYRRIADFGGDIEALVDDLGLERFGAVGLSGGGPYVLATAYHMPERTVVGSLLGGIGPIRGPDAVWSYTRGMRFLAPTLEVLRSPLGSVLGPVIGAAERIGEELLDVASRLFGRSDREVLSDPDFAAMFIADLSSAGQLRSVAHDLALFSRHWGFLLEEVTSPIVVWQGLADAIVPPSHGHHQASRLPNAQLRVRPGEGHFAGFAEVAEVLDAAREVWAGETLEPSTD